MKKFLVLFFSLFAVVAAPLRGETLLTITSDRKINFFDSASPGTYFKTVDIQGLAGADVLLSAACSPTGELFVLTHAGSSMGVRTVNPQTGAILENLSSTGAYPASATAFGMDVAPPSPLRADVVSDADEIRGFSVFALFGAISISYDNATGDGDPVDVHAGADPAIVGVAHTNNFPGAESSVLYGIDSTQDTRVMIERTPGRLNTIGALGVNTGLHVGFDISGVTGNAYAAFSTIAGPLLYKIDLSTGAGTQIGQLPTPSAGAEILALTTLPPTRVANISTRARVGAGDDVMIAGFIAPGGGDKRRLLVRGIGPSLGNSGVSSALADPALRIVDGNGVEIATNNDWRATQESQIFDTGLAPTNDLEAAYLGQFAAGLYTAILSGNGGGTGLGLIEVYQFNN
jgi:hypothetical protein